MCGIVGIFDTLSLRDVSPELLHTMNETQFHRGPDEGGVHVEPGLGLAHRRLSIIDLASGQQPLFNEDGSVVVTYNGEIYNFKELAADLVNRGHQFRTHCDTEVIVHAWEEWGEACVEHFRGMFAFAVWDQKQETLFLARDRLGIKPLYYSLLGDGSFIFGSELKSLLAHPGFERKLDPFAVENFFSYGYVPDPQSIYASARKLAPGHTLTLRRGRPAPKPVRYWDISFGASSVLSDSVLEEQLIEQLREAVRIRMIADVPLGAFLSGGVDSSAVVAMMAGLSNRPVKTCSISFNEKQFNESEYADLVAARYETEHISEMVGGNDFDLVETLPALFDEPFADSSAIPTYRVCQLARKNVIVALSGDGGDENFAGYRRYQWHQQEENLRHRFPQSVRKHVFGPLGRLYPQMPWAPRLFRAKSTFEAISSDPIQSYLNNVSLFSGKERARLFSESLQGDLQGYRAIEVFRQHLANAPTDDSVSTVQYLDFKTYLPGDILTKVDRTSMAHALEVRVPILDHKFVEFAAGLPSAVKLREGQGKHAFKQSLRPYLSDDVLYRKKMGFAVPLSKWFQGEGFTYARDRILGSTMLDSGLFSPMYMDSLLSDHQAGKQDSSSRIWALLMFESCLSRNGY